MKHTACTNKACLSTCADRRRQGFTLLELLVTSVMIAVLTVIGIVSYSSVNKRSRDVKRKSDLEQMRSALEMYRSDSSGGIYPDNLNLLVSQYLPAVPTDSNTIYPYVYHGYPGAGPYTTYCVFAKLETLGAEIQNTCTAEIPPTGYNYGLKNP
jgi:prepilin-type N-terminal cleavage/methylation domain-containing protein